MSTQTMIQESIQITNEDCMELMARYSDNHFDLAIVDPPYGIDVANMGLGKGVGTESRTWTAKDWDSQIPNEDYFKELIRVSKRQIIWGGNYFLDYLGATKCLIIWDKMQEFSGATFETAWTNFDSPSKAFRLSRVQAYTNKIKVHPTQKPISLYTWILAKYATDGQRILDTHLGSGSIAIAVDSVNKIEKMNLTLTACEIDKEYYDAAMARIKSQTSWQSLF